jgi:hypothetical protein
MVAPSPVTRISREKKRYAAVSLVLICVKKLFIIALGVRKEMVDICLCVFFVLCTVLTITKMNGLEKGSSGLIVSLFHLAALLNNPLVAVLSAGQFLK